MTDIIENLNDLIENKEEKVKLIENLVENKESIVNLDMKESFLSEKEEKKDIYFEYVTKIEDSQDILNELVNVTLKIDEIIKNIHPYSMLAITKGDLKTVTHIHNAKIDLKNASDNIQKTGSLLMTYLNDVIAKNKEVFKNNEEEN